MTALFQLSDPPTFKHIPAMVSAAIDLRIRHLFEDYTFYNKLIEGGGLRCIAVSVEFTGSLNQGVLDFFTAWGYHLENQS